MSLSGELLSPMLLQASSLAFFVLGVVALMAKRQPVRLRTSRHLGWLAGFGMLYGLQRFVAAERMHLPLAELDTLSAGLAVMCFTALLEFGRRVWNDGAKGARLHAFPVYLVVLLGFGLTGSFSMSGVEWGARHFIGVPGALLSAAGLFWHTKVPAASTDIQEAVLWLRRGAFALFAFAAALVLPSLVAGGLPMIALADAAAAGAVTEGLCAALGVVAFWHAVESRALVASVTLRRVTDQLDGFVYRCRNDPDWTIMFMSDGGERLTGLPADAFMRAEVHFADMMHPDDRERVWEQVQVALARRQDFSLEYRMIDQTGVTRWCFEEGRGVFSKAGELLYLEGYVRDDSARRKADDARRRLQVLVDVSPQPIGWTDADGTVRYMNKALRGLLSIPKTADLSTYQLRDFYSDEEFERVESRILPDVSSRGAWVGEVELTALDGRKIPTLHNVFSLSDQADSAPAIANVLTDLSQIRRAERQLRIKDAAIATSTSAIAMADPDGRLSYVNQAFLDLWKFPDAESALGLSAVDVWENPASAEAVIHAISRSGDWTGELRARLMDGSLRDIELNAHMVRDRHGEPVCLMGSFMDVTERNAARQALQQERDFATSILNTAPVIILLLDAEARIRHVNRYFEEMVGYCLEEVQGKRWITEFIPEREWERIHTLFGKTLGGRAVHGAINPIVTRGGTEREIEWHASRIFDAVGNSGGVLAVGMDVTERRANFARAEMLQRLTDNSPQPIAWASIDGEVRYLNKAFRVLMGVPEKTTNGEYLVRDFYREDVFERLETRFVPQAVERGHWVGEVEMAAPDGRVVPTIHSLFCLRDGQEEIIALAVVVTDLTDLKKAQAALEESEFRYRRLFELSKDGILYADVESTQLVLANSSFAQMLGCRQEDISRFTVEDIHPPDALPRVRKIFEQLARGSIDRAEDIPLLRLDGSVVYADVTASRVALAGRSLLAGIFRDVSNRRNESQRIQDMNQVLEARVRERTEALERANAAKDDFLSRMSHELRTPLNAIIGFSQLLALPGGKVLDEEQLGNVREIREAGEHLLALVDEVLDLAQIESGRLRIEPEPVKLIPLIEHCAALMAPDAARRFIDVSLDLGEPVMVWADPTRLRQVLLNLLSNAVKYNSQNGLILITCERPLGERHVRVCVRDTGRGLGADQQDRLFRPFERLESAYDGIAGSGIGLALTKRLVEGMGGEIGVRSTLGEGSVFWFELPLSSEPVSCAEESSEPVSSTMVGDARCRLLYIEDNPANLRLVEKVLERRKGLELLCATTAERGLQLAASEDVVLILVDINLPDVDGFEVLRRLKSDPITRSIPVIAVTANAMPSDVQRGKDSGFRHYLTKPLNIREFLEVVDHCLGCANDKS